MGLPLDLGPLFLRPRVFAANFPLALLSVSCTFTEKRCSKNALRALLGVFSSRVSDVVVLVTAY
jgi:hypothetical protein